MYCPLEHKQHKRRHQLLLFIATLAMRKRTGTPLVGGVRLRLSGSDLLGPGLQLLRFRVPVCCS